MEEKFMKCTDAWSIAKMLHIHMEKELKAALMAHGGEFSWYSEEEDEGKDEDEKYADNTPVVMCDHKYVGPMDVKIRKVYIDSGGYVRVTAATVEYNVKVCIELCDIVAHHIQFIIESIPVTDTVTDVSIPFSIGE